MKKLILFSMMLSIGLFTSCSSSSDDDPTMDPEPGDTAITYANTVSAIISGSCNNCHSSPPKNGAPMGLNTFTLVKDAVENRNLITRIENGTMPPNGNLSATQIQNIKTWRDANFPQ